MSTSNDNAMTRSKLFQLIALGFSHPVPAFHSLLVDGDYARAVCAATLQAGGCSEFNHSEQRNFADFEADYIYLFNMGRRGKPLVPLTAGDHDLIAQGQGRPEFMLGYSAWYKHFGLQTNTDEGANELPDHLVCQLEFLSWLAHLEETATEDAELEHGYQLAQKDFMQRHLLPFLEVLTSELKKRGSEPRIDPLYLTLATHALETFDSVVAQLDIELEQSPLSALSSAEHTSEVVNLWG